MFSAVRIDFCKSCDLGALYKPAIIFFLPLTAMLSLFIVTVLAVLFLVKFMVKVKQYPPGPRPLPLIGNMFSVYWEGFGEGGIRPLLHRWKKEYGPVFTIWAGPMPLVTIYDYDLAVEMMVKKGQTFADRAYFYIQEINRQGRGIITSNGHHWLEQRRFALHTLRDFGLGRNLMEERIMLEYDYRTNILEKKIAESGGRLRWDPRQFCELTVGNIINRMLFSERFTDEKETEFFRMKKRMDEIMENTSIVDGFLSETNRHWPFFNRRYLAMKGAEDMVLDFIRRQIEDKKRLLESGHSGDCEDFVQTYLTKMKTGEYSDEFNEEALLLSLFDLWIAGQESTATTLQWGLAYLIRYSETLKKLQEELDTVTGRNRNVSLKDRPNVPYLNAVVQETLRVGALLPLNVLARSTTEDIQIRGYTIPKGTAVSAQLAVVMSEEKDFKDPYEFNPDRYLSGEPEQNVIAFGLGKRACPGESLARAELFMLIGNLALNFDMQAVPGQEPSMVADQENVVIRKSKNFNMYISRRE